MRTVGVSGSERRVGVARTRAGVHSEHAAAEKGGARYPAGCTKFSKQPLPR
jgi:hypothetical protein